MDEGEGDVLPERGGGEIPDSWLCSCSAEACPELCWVSAKSSRCETIMVLDEL